MKHGCDSPHIVTNTAAEKVAYGYVATRRRTQSLHAELQRWRLQQFSLELKSEMTVFDTRRCECISNSRLQKPSHHPNPSSAVVFHENRRPAPDGTTLAENYPTKRV